MVYRNGWRRRSSVGAVQTAAHFIRGGMKPVPNAVKPLQVIKRIYRSWWRKIDISAPYRLSCKIHWAGNGGVVACVPFGRISHLLIGGWYNNEFACEDISNDWQQSFYWFWNMALFVPKAWKWYSYIDINATELVVAVRAIMDIYTPEKRKNKQNGSIGTSWNISI